MKKYRTSIFLFAIFEVIAVSLWLSTGNLFFLLNFSYIGICLGVGGILMTAGGETCPRVHAVHRWQLHFGVPRPYMSREYADGRILVLSAVRGCRGGGAALSHRQDLRAVAVRARLVRVRLLDCDDPRPAALQAARETTEILRMGALCDVRVVDRRRHPADAPRQSRQNDDVLPFRGWKCALLRRRNRPGHRAEGQPRLLQVHLPDHRLPEADELLLVTAHQVRRGEVHPLRQVPESLPDGGGSQQQFAQAEERHRVHPLPAMQEGVSGGGAEIVLSRRSRRLTQTFFCANQQILPGLPSVTIQNISLLVKFEPMATTFHHLHFAELESASEIVF